MVAVFDPDVDGRLDRLSFQAAVHAPDRQGHDWSYLLLGWLPIIPAWAYLNLVPLGALAWILVGGLCYTAGTVFLVLDHRRLHFHAIWHVFVIAGSACHYCGIFHFVACAPLPVS